MLHAREDYNRIQDPENKIPADEPVFLLRAQDKIAWHIVKIYAYCAELAGASPILVEKCKKHAELMKAWKTKKVPDLP
jgi:hypothetical protein